MSKINKQILYSVHALGGSMTNYRSLLANKVVLKELGLKRPFEKSPMQTTRYKLIFVLDSPKIRATVVKFDPVSVPAGLKWL